MAKTLFLALMLALLPLCSIADETGSPATVGSAPVKVEIYGTSWCGYCKMARKFFTSKKVPYVEYDIEKDEQAYVRFRKMNPQGGVPFVVIGRYGVPGYQEQAYRQALELSLTPEDKAKASPQAAPIR